MSLRTTAVLLLASSFVVGCGHAASAPTTAPAPLVQQPVVPDVALDRYEFEKPEMGTLFRIVLWASDKAIADQAAKAAWARVEDLNHVLSDYNPQSELSRLCSQTDAGPMTEPTRASDDLWTVVSAAVEASRLSDGAFDISIGPLTRIQRTMRKTGQMPDPEELRKARECVGWRYIELNSARHTIRLLHANMRLDVGGIAKGYTSGQVLKTLESLGIDHALCGAAGDIVAGNAPPRREHWVIGIQSLKSPETVSGHVQIRNYAISTSGDTYRAAEVDGQRFSHIVDPKTGVGLKQRIGVTALAPDGITADWITKPISILGPEKGLEIIEKIPGAAARIVTIDDAGNEKVFESKRFAGFLATDDLSMKEIR